jgi:transcriptional regulator with XRE-family HTH domain
MYQQPELGKKIGEFRRLKGLTQAELVEMCNLSVRTLQRIEAGEVTPRVHTIKSIFKILELDFENYLYSQQNNKRGLRKKWLKQFYISFIDLFNLKTNTMKKISILSIMLSAIVFGLFTMVTEINGQSQNKDTPHIGFNWEQINNELIKDKYFGEYQFKLSNKE